MVVVHKPSLFFIGNSDSNISSPFRLNHNFRLIKGESSKESFKIVAFVRAASWSLEESLADRMAAEIQRPTSEN